MSRADSIKARLRNLSISEQKPYEYIQTHYCIERLLYRLSVSRYSSDFILKGGLLLHALFENRARATRDIDLLARHMDNTPESMISVFQEICGIEANDAVSFDTGTLSAQRIKEDADYEGVRVKLVAYLDRSRSTLQFDIGFGDVVVPKPELMTYPSILDMDETNIYVYSKESIIAEKFQAMLCLAQANSRMKDFYDIAMLAAEHDFDGAVLREAIYQTLVRRTTPLSTEPVVFEERFATDKDKQAQWMGFTNRIHIQAPSFEETLATLERFLHPIHQAILNEDEFFRIWDHTKSIWLDSRA